MILLIFDDGQIGALQVCFLYANVVYSEAVHCRVCQQSSNCMTGINHFIDRLEPSLCGLRMPWRARE